MPSARIACLSVALVMFAAAMALAAPAAPRAAAQTPPTPAVGTPPPIPPPPPALRDPAPGDIVWTLAQEFPFTDDRVALALSAYVTPLVDTDPTTGVLPAEPRHRVGVPPTDLTLLMEAAGLRPRGATVPSSLRVLGPCKFWVGEAPDGFTSTASLAKTADSIAGAFVLGVRDLLNVPLERCIPTANVTDAHLLVWVQGARPPANPQRDAPTLLTAGQVALPSGVAAPSPAKTGIGPGSGGSLRLIDVAQGGALAAVILTLAAVLGARALARRTG